MHNFRELKIWQKSVTLVKAIYILTQTFPKEEIYGITNQIRRCAVSIPSNIAEGCGRNTNKQLIQFLDIAHGSSCELETQLIIANELEFISIDQLNLLMADVHEVQKMIFGFKNSLKSQA
jgi:four helix bundle protein